MDPDRSFQDGGPKKQARGRYPHLIIYKCYSELFSSIDQTCESNIDFLNEVWKFCLLKHIDTVIMTKFLGLLFMFRIFSDDPYISIIFLRTMVNILFFSSRNSKYILTEPQMAKTYFKSLQRQQRNQTFKFSCNPAVYTDHTGQFNTKYAAI